MESGKKTKLERTTQEQLQYFLEFCREHPELQAGKNNPKAPKAVQNLWEELATNLNSMRGATRTAAKWKESLSHWKNQVRSRARRAKAESLATGGGPRAEGISEFEQHALETFGSAAVDGFPGIGSLGLQVSLDEVLAEPPTEVIPTTSNEIPSHLLQKDDVVESLASFQDESGPSYPSKRKKQNTEDVIDIALKSLRTREERDEKIATQQAQREELLMKQQQEIVSALQQMSQMSFEEMAKGFENFVEQFDQSL